MRSTIVAGLGIPASLLFASMALAQPPAMPAPPTSTAPTTVILTPNAPSAAPVQVIPAQSTVIVAPNPPPPPREEVPPPPPASTTTIHVWEMGHWQWNGSDWTWIAGTYVVRPTSVSQTAIWHPGYWVRMTDGWQWVEGHWE
jgi:hypothetical protein